MLNSDTFQNLLLWVCRVSPAISDALDKAVRLRTINILRQKIKQNKTSYNGARSATGKATKSETLLFKIRKSYMYMA